MRRTVQPGADASLSFDAGADAGHAWRLQVFINNDKLLDRLVDGAKLPKDESSKRAWEHRNPDLARYRNQTAVIRLYDLILVPGHAAGNSDWKNFKLQ